MAAITATARAVVSTEKRRRMEPPDPALDISLRELRPAHAVAIDVLLNTGAAREVAVASLAFSQDRVRRLDSGRGGRVRDRGLRRAAGAGGVGVATGNPRPRQRARAARAACAAPDRRGPGGAGGRGPGPDAGGAQRPPAPSR